MNNLTLSVLFISTFLVAFCDGRYHRYNVRKNTIAPSEDVKVKTDTPIEIAAIGRVSQLGGFYDARSDQFLHLSLFNNALKNSSITATSNRETKLKYTLEDSIEEKFRIIDVSAELKLSILFGMIKLHGSGRYFKETKKSAKSAKASLIQTFLTVYEEISITDENIETVVNMDLLGQVDYATHVVVGIQWGGRVLISVEDTNSEDKNKQEIEGNLGVKMKRIFRLIDGEVNLSKSDKAEMNKFNFEIYGDILPNSVPTNLIQAVTFMKNVPSLVKEANNGKGKAIKYTLIPISLLRKLWKINSSANTILKRIKEETIQKCVELFNNMNLVEQKLNDLVEDVKKFEPYIATSKVKQVKSLQLNYSLYQTRLRENLSKHLLLVRSGNETFNNLEEVIFQSTNDSLSWENVDTKIDEFSNLKSEISFIKMMIKLNVTLLDKNQKFQHFLWDNFHNDIYILFYNYNQADSLNKYMNKFRVMLEERQEYGLAVLFASANFEILRKNDTLSEDTKISLYRKGKCYMDKYELGNDTDNANNTNPQTWSLFEIQNKLSWQIKEISELKQNPIPINFIYIQLRSQPDPYSLWPTVEWKDVTSKYSGLFFRAEGCDSASFGKIQQDNAPRVTQVERIVGYSRDNRDLMPLKPNSWSEYIYTGRYFGNSNKYTFTRYLTSGGEVRPRNTAIRIWKRTG